MADPVAQTSGEILRFWFTETRPYQWFAKDLVFDALVRAHFIELTRHAIQGELRGWPSEAPSALALVLLLDQFPRQIWRDTAMAFAGDDQAPRSARTQWPAAG